MEPEEGEDRTPLLKEPRLDGAGEGSGRRPSPARAAGPGRGRAGLRRLPGVVSPWSRAGLGAAGGERKGSGGEAGGGRGLGKRCAGCFCD